MTTDPPPSRRKWHLNRWLFVLIVAMFGWSGWRAYAFRSALAQANALGWTVQYTDPVETIRKNWRAAFKKGTWLDGVMQVYMPTSEAFEQHASIVHRLNPKRLQIYNAATLRDVSVFKPLAHLTTLQLDLCRQLTNLDALKNLSFLEVVWLTGCTGLSKESVAALKAAHPNAIVFGP